MSSLSENVWIHKIGQNIITKFYYSIKYYNLSKIIQKNSTTPTTNKI